ncbi:hypothetical protein H1P_3680006 [Hyella patelloides LEGE 07179]|uniref:Uncharacterized protein n=1 Tax=Hyella patelloides LEGE 07179 TaxID=945734 RepID=A0A563VWC7_9CYAN|nr:hypothetical protein H1P_3680006 [Hyella patelloides LEGE 07179]
MKFRKDTPYFPTKFNHQKSRLAFRHHKEGSEARVGRGVQDGRLKLGIQPTTEASSF